MTQTRMRAQTKTRRYVEVGGGFLRELRYGTRLWVKDRAAQSGEADEQAVRLRGTAAERRDDWMLSDDTMLTSAELAKEFLIVLPDMESR